MPQIFARLHCRTLKPASPRIACPAQVLDRNRLNGRLLFEQMMWFFYPYTHHRIEFELSDMGCDKEACDVLLSCLTSELPNFVVSRFNLITYGSIAIAGVAAP